MGEDEINDAMLVQAMRRRLMDEISERGGRASSVVNNNVYGGGLRDGGMGAGPMDDGGSDRDYFVDILKEDLETDPETGKSKGWRKKVHRFSTPKKKVMMGPMVEEPSLRDQE